MSLLWKPKSRGDKLSWMQDGIAMGFRQSNKPAEVSQSASGVTWPERGCTISHNTGAVLIVAPEGGEKPVVTGVVVNEPVEPGV